MNLDDVKHLWKKYTLLIENENKEFITWIGDRLDADPWFLDVPDPPKIYLICNTGYSYRMRSPTFIKQNIWKFLIEKSELGCATLLFLCSKIFNHLLVVLSELKIAKIV